MLLRQRRRHCLRCQLRDCQAALFCLRSGPTVDLFVNGDRDRARGGHYLVLPAIRISPARALWKPQLSTCSGPQEDTCEVMTRMAVRLSKGLGSAPRFWVQMQADYDAAEAEQMLDPSDFARLQRAGCFCRSDRYRHLLRTSAT